MKGKIDKKGILSIERGAKIKPQICPFSLTPEFLMPCGDFCPLFGEPRLEIDSNGASITICHEKILFLDEFTDERGGGEVSWK